MDTVDKDKYINRYTERYKQYGYDPRALGWSIDRKKQYYHFSSLCSIADLNNKTIIDVGCGFRDFMGF